MVRSHYRERVIYCAHMHAIERDVRQCGDSQKGVFLQRFFKTGKGEYAEGDRFLGVSVPVCRALAKKHTAVELDEVFYLLTSPLHEVRLVALLILIEIFKKDPSLRAAIYKRYMRSYAYINNWDLVDLSAHHIAGSYAFSHASARKELIAYARSSHLWKKRIAMISSFYFIREHEFVFPLQVAQILVHDAHDLIQKAVGWMLREIGKRELSVERAFLDQYAGTMPRTMLRYAIERFDPALRQKYMKMKI